jgi:predicted phosphodiesterase
MKFILISDIHADMNPWDWNLMSDLDTSLPVAVAGDINNDVRGTSRWILDLRNIFPTVIWVAGNHDAYNSGFRRTRLSNPEFDKLWPYPTDVQEIYDHYQRWSDYHGIHFLNRSSVVIEGVEFVGATGWHNFDASPYLSMENQIRAWQQSMSDSSWCDWNHDEPYQAVLHQARGDADYIRDAVEANDLPKVVVTHHIPQKEFVKVTTDLEWNLLNGSFLNTWLSDCLHPSIGAWCFGHTHYRTYKNHLGIDFVNNARGYSHENASWRPVEIEIDTRAISSQPT